MSDIRALLGRTAELAGDFIESLDARPVFPQTSVDELREALGGPLPEEPTSSAGSSGRIPGSRTPASG